MALFYWLKLRKDFFKRHDMMILEAKENGYLYELLFVKLMTESIDHEGELRYSPEIPYTTSDLAVICRMSEEVVENGLELFKKLGLIVIDENQTIIIPIAQSMIGSAVDSDTANRQRRSREKRSSDNVVTKCHNDVTHSVTKCHNECDKKSREIEIEIEKEIDKRDRDRYIERGKNEPNGSKPPTKTKSRFVPPDIEEIKEYAQSRNSSVNPQRFFDFYSSKNWYVGKNKMTDWKAALRNWETREREEKPRRKAEEIPIMENEYSEEHLRQKEEESDAYLDFLLEEGDIP